MYIDPSHTSQSWRQPRLTQSLLQWPPDSLTKRWKRLIRPCEASSSSWLSTQHQVFLSSLLPHFKHFSSTLLLGQSCNLSRLPVICLYMCSLWSNCIVSVWTQKDSTWKWANWEENEVFQFTLDVYKCLHPIPHSCLRLKQSDYRLISFWFQLTVWFSLSSLRLRNFLCISMYSTVWFSLSRVKLA